MNLTSGARLGAYEIVDKLGEGGMGEVYRARDTRLDRLVAIKVLPAVARDDPDRRQRFEREARAVAALNHPHICTLHDVGHEGDVHFLVMELVEGETLAARLQRGPLPLDQALRHAIELSSALDRAHRQSIIHRDLKPANVVLTRAGAKLLDFGLAKLRPTAGTTDTLLPTQLAGETAQGMILGTLQYMSPEQLEGSDADARSDIFALGAVLFEMVTGRKAFEGKSQASLITAIMSGAPPSIAAHVPLAPAALDRVVRTCLAKDPDERWQTASDLGRELRWIADEHKTTTGGMQVSSTGSVAAPVPVPRRRAGGSMLLVAGVGIIAALAGWLGASSFARPEPAPSYSGVQFAIGDFASDPLTSPNGSLVAFQIMVDGQSQIAVLQPESGDFTVLTRDRTRGSISSFNWSADGTKIYYGRIDGVPVGIFTIPAVGGEERLVVEDAVGPQILPDGSLLIARINDARRYQLHRYWPDTRRLQTYPVLIAGGIDYNRMMVAFRDGKEAAFWGTPLGQAGATEGLYVLDLATEAVRRLTTEVTLPNTDLSPPIATGAGDQSIVTVDRKDALARIVEIPRAGGPARLLIAVPEGVTGLAMAPNGDLYIDQYSRPFEALVLDANGGNSQTVLTVYGNAVNPRASSVLPDGRIVFQTRRGARNRLLVARSGQAPVPFVQTDEETTGPVAAVGHDEVALLLGATRTLTIASAHDGRIVRQFPQAHASAINQVAALPDGSTLFYAASGKIWSIGRTGDGAPVAIRDGEAVAVDPRDRSLIIQLNEQNNVRLIRHFLSGQPEAPMSFPGLRPATPLIAANAVGPAGLILKNASYSDSWTWNLAMLNPATGATRRIMLPARDAQTAGWTASGQVVVFAPRTLSTLWRLRPNAQ